MFHPDHRVLPITGGSVVTRGRKNVRMPPTTIKKANDLFFLPIDSIHESPLASKRGHEECGHHGTSGLRAQILNWRGPISHVPCPMALRTFHSTRYTATHDRWCSQRHARGHHPHLAPNDKGCKTREAIHQPQA